jgi:DNA-directed RNA polymerase subunit A"
VSGLEDRIEGLLREVCEEEDVELPVALEREIVERVAEDEDLKEADEETLRRVLRALVRNYKVRMIEPGDAVGVLAAQSMCEPATQMTMRTFHLAGVAEIDVTTGIPALERVLSLPYQGPPTWVIYLRLKEPYNRDEEKAEAVARKIRETRFEDLVREIEVNPEERVIEATLDREEMERLGVDEDELTEFVREFTGGACQVEGDTLRVVLTDVESISELAELANELREAVVKGIEGVLHASVQYDEEEEEYYILVRGSPDGTSGRPPKWISRRARNSKVAKRAYLMLKLMQLDEVDATRVNTNDPKVIDVLLGIEAGRNAVIEQLEDVYESQGISVDRRHFMLISDMMAFWGELRSVRSMGGYSIMELKGSPLTKAAFEYVSRVLTETATSGDVEELRGILENIIVGRPVPVGTGTVEVTVDYSRFREAEEEEE